MPRAARPHRLSQRRGSSSIAFRFAPGRLQFTHELIVLEESLETLLWSEVAFGVGEYFPRALGGGREVSAADRRRSSRGERARLLGSPAGEQCHRETCAHGDADQELQREAGHSAVHNLAERRLRDIEFLRRYELTDARTHGASCDLMRDIEAKSLDGGDIG